VVSSHALEQQPQWVSATKIFKSGGDKDILAKAGVKTMDDPRYEKYTERLAKVRAILNYQYVMQVLPRELSYKEVAEIFVRVNSLGAKLRGSDLAMAQITAQWPKSLALLEEFQDECEENWMTLDLGLLVRSMVVFATGQSRFERVATTSISKLKEGWEHAKEGLRYAVNFLKSNADIEDESLLSSTLFFITIAYFSHLKDQSISKDDERSLLHWLYVANARGRYSRGSSETILDEDINILKKGKTPKDLLSAVQRQFGRLNIEPEDFAGRGAGSPLFPLVFLAMKKAGAKDWYTGLGLSLTHQGKYHTIQYHHIFPKSLLKGKYERREINEIANMAFITGRTNRRLGNKEPADYLPKIIKERGKEALTKQAVPMDVENLRIENYRTFLEKRRKELAFMVNKLIDSSFS